MTSGGLPLNYMSHTVLQPLEVERVCAVISSIKYMSSKICEH